METISTLNVASASWSAKARPLKQTQTGALQENAERNVGFPTLAAFHRYYLPSRSSSRFQTDRELQFSDPIFFATCVAVRGRWNFCLLSSVIGRAAAFWPDDPGHWAGSARDMDALELPPGHRVGQRLGNSDMAALQHRPTSSWADLDGSYARHGNYFGHSCADAPHCHGDGPRGRDCRSIGNKASQRVAPLHRLDCRTGPLSAHAWQTGGEALWPVHRTLPTCRRDWIYQRLSNGSARWVVMSLGAI